MIRFFDVLLSAITLLLLLPLFLPIVILLRFTGEGEIFFLQERIGKDGKKFELFKFATMLKNSPDIGTGTVTMNIGQAVKDVKAGKIDFKVDKYGIVHAAIGKASFESNQIVDNAKELIAALVKLKPSSAKGQYVKSVTLSSTMSPGVKVEPKSVDA